jgi:RNA-binding protein
MLTTKQKVYLRSLAQTEKPIFQIGKDGLSENLIETVKNGIRKRELIKISVLQNCDDDAREIAEVIAERTRSQVVQVIGKKIVLYKEGKDKNKKIELPKAAKKNA